MRLARIICVVSALTAVPAVVAARQDHHSSPAAAAMGFDQERTAHHFFLFSDGGAIDVGVREAGDATNREAIRSHLSHIAVMFGRGNFETPMLVHDSINVPGTKTMAARKTAIRYQYVETANGGRVNIFATDRDALEAVHAFLKYQIAEHHTGDSTTVRTR